PVFIGPDNYVRALSLDPQFRPSLAKTFYYALVVVPVGLTVSMLLATLLNQKLGGTNVFRTLYFMPHLTPIVATALVWKVILNPEVGLINTLLYDAVGIKGPGWLSSVEWA